MDIWWMDWQTDWQTKNDIALAHLTMWGSHCIHFEKVYARLNIELDFLWPFGFIKHVPIVRAGVEFMFNNVSHKETNWHTSYLELWKLTWKWLSVQNMTKPLPIWSLWDYNQLYKCCSWLHYRCHVSYWTIELVSIYFYHSVILSYIAPDESGVSTYHIRFIYHSYPYKRTVKQFRSLQITGHVSTSLSKHIMVVLIWIASTSWGNSNEYQQHMLL